jgi:hypothetical protein
MSDWYLVDLSCDLKPDTPQEFIDHLKSLFSGQAVPFPDFPGWSMFKLKKVEKLEGFFCYSLTLRYVIHEDIAANDDNDFFFLYHKLAQYSETQGFVGFELYSASFSPVLIYFEDGKWRIWDIRQYDAHQWEFEAQMRNDINELTYQYELARKALSYQYEQKLKELQKRYSQDNQKAGENYNKSFDDF